MDLFTSLVLMAMIALVVLNVVAYQLYRHDKEAALAGARRIRESDLLVIALLGGSLGALLACRIWRHKTRKQPFRALLLSIAGLHLFAIYAVPTLLSGLAPRHPMIDKALAQPHRFDIAVELRGIGH